MTTNYYPDTDADGFGAGVARAACTAPVGYVANSTDCNDAANTVRPGAPEICNGLDDDCDGTVDESCTCTPGSTRSCGLSVGVCTNGTQTCTGTGWTACTGVAPSVETCNGADDDCDGFSDDVVPALSGLTISCGALSPVFDPATTMYRVTAASGATSCVVQPTVACPAGLAITVNGTAVSSGGSVSAALTGVVSAIAIRVTATDGMSRIYDVVVTKSSMYIKASNTGSNDSFGYSVALSGDGATLAVGAHNEDSAATGVGGDQASNAASESGAVYVFRRSVGGVWAQEAYVKASNTGSRDQFGCSVALSGDGATLAVGACLEASAARGVGGDQASNTSRESGAVYVFRRSVGGVWAQEAYVKASNTGIQDYFGYSVALSGDGATLAVSALREASAATGVGGDQTSNAASVSGAVYVFRRSVGGVWAQEAYVKASNTGSADLFGQSVALSGDGATLAVGAWFEDSAATGVGGDQTSNAASVSGAVYVFRRSVGGVWAQEAYVKASNTDSNDYFGYSVALSGDGATLAVGAHNEDSAATGVGGDQASNAASESGAVYVFRRSVGGVWAQEAYVKASNTGSDDYFGSSVALSGDGATLAVGAHNEGSAATGVGGDQASNAFSSSGAVYVFRRSVGGVWAQEAYVKASNTGFNDLFGTSVALSGDGATLAVGAWFEDSAATGIGGDQTSNAATDSGAVYVF